MSAMMSSTRPTFATTSVTSMRVMFGWSFAMATWMRALAIGSASVASRWTAGAPCRRLGCITMKKLGCKLCHITFRRLVIRPVTSWPETSNVSTSPSLPPMESAKPCSREISSVWAIPEAQNFPAVTASDAPSRSRHVRFCSRFRNPSPRCSPGSSSRFRAWVSRTGLPPMALSLARTIGASIGARPVSARRRSTTRSRWADCTSRKNRLGRFPAPCWEAMGATMSSLMNCVAVVRKTARPMTAIISAVSPRRAPSCPKARRRDRGMTFAVRR